ncbi:AraC family transcriptional regulator [Diplocloster agilis]|uniref:AraC family transcriptional regulator n=1 Tax=Diplocloster agilis TaxID=2850323 RepID=A0A949K727_9FIRM|nr:AraC family transcriptional regulator [Diplocloster agilis]MBU9736537.1 AraC family transcriptional regulator [Diplocloster agilis]MBU9744389.1 AraC family transcriptional regulator [Diplocloster agilis]
MIQINNPQFKEKADHRIGLLPLKLYHMPYSQKISSFPMHWHNEFEITLAQSGKGLYRIDSREYIIEKNDIIIISPRVMHSGQRMEQLDFVTDSFVFQPGFLSSALPEVTSLNYLNPIFEGELCFIQIIRPSQPGHKDLKHCFLNMKSCYINKEPYYELRLKELLLHFFYLLFHHNFLSIQKSRPVIRENEEKIRIALKYIEEHYSDDLSIDKLADLTGFSPCHFMNTFKKYVGLPCNKYITQFRLDLAAKLLSETRDPIMNIALMIGYNNISYFNRSFRDKFGITPREYRNEFL